MQTQLITIPFSHYCEKARWALDIAAVPYREQAWVPGLHLLATRMRGRGGSVPVLVTQDACITDSTDILRYADGCAALGLYPPGAAELEDWLDESLGPAVRIVGYHHLLPDPPRLMALLGGAFSAPGRLLLRAVLPTVGPKIRALYRIDAASSARAEDQVRTVFARADALLAEGRPYLAGDRFSAADLTLAALGGVVLVWPEMVPRRRGRPAPSTDPIGGLPAHLAGLCRELRATRVAAHIRGVYARHRWPKP